MCDLCFDLMLLSVKHCDAVFPPSVTDIREDIPGEINENPAGLFAVVKKKRGNETELSSNTVWNKEMKHSQQIKQIIVIVLTFEFVF